MKILVVGGAGYLGGAVTDILCTTSGHQVRVYDLLLYEDRYLKQGVEFVFGDVLDYERLSPHLKWADAVIWLAAIVGDGACAINPELSKKVNQESIGFLVKKFKGRIVFPSTCSVYGASSGILDELSVTTPLSVYAQTKLQAEDYLRDSNSVIFRLGTLFGMSDYYSRIRFDLVVNTLTLRAHIDKKLTVFGGDQFRPVLHVRDAAKSICLATVGGDAGIYNLHKQNVRISDLAYQIRNHFSDAEIIQTPMEFEDSRNYRVSSDKAIDVLGFCPTTSIDFGIEQIKWVLGEGRIKDPSHPNYSNQSHLRAAIPKEG